MKLVLLPRMGFSGLESLSEVTNGRRRSVSVQEGAHSQLRRAVNIFDNERVLRSDRRAAQIEAERFHLPQDSGALVATLETEELVERRLRTTLELTLLS